MNHDFSNAKVGQEVTSSTHGYGVIDEVDFKKPHYPISVKFSRHTTNGSVIRERYTLYGRALSSDFLPTLFKGKVSQDSFDTTYNIKL